MRGPSIGSLFFVFFCELKSGALDLLRDMTSLVHLDLLGNFIGGIDRISGHVISVVWLFFGNCVSVCE
jgi:hypothetical protein